MNPAVQNQIRGHTQAFYIKSLPQLAERYGGANNIPEQVMAEFKRSCSAQAKAAVLNMLQQQGRLQQAQQAQAQQQAQAMQAMQGGMAG